MDRNPGRLIPEQYRGKEVSFQSDVYSLGCVLYEMLAGEPPFTGPTVQAVIADFAFDPATINATAWPACAADGENVATG